MDLSKDNPATEIWRRTEYSDPQNRKIDMWECVSAIGESMKRRSEAELESMKRFAGYVTLDGILFPFVIDDATNIEEAFSKFSSAYQKAIAKKSIVVPGRSGFKM